MFVAIDSNLVSKGGLNSGEGFAELVCPPRGGGCLEGGNGRRGKRNLPLFLLGHLQYMYDAIWHKKFCVCGTRERAGPEWALHECVRVVRGEGCQVSLHEHARVYMLGCQHVFMNSNLNRNSALKIKRVITRRVSF